MDPAGIAVRPLSERDARAPGEVGRRARLAIDFAVRRGRTQMARQYAEPPFRVGRPFVREEHTHLIVASTAPGIFGGDRLEQVITVGPGARVRLTSQSSLQIHPSAIGLPASLASRYAVGRGGHLACEWDPNIPFPGARMDQRIDIELDEGATLLWSDAVMSGREARGERWQFDTLGHELRLTRRGVLVYLERYRLEPASMTLGSRWIAGDACYFGTVLIVDPAMNGSVAESVYRELSGAPDLEASADALEDGIVLVRLLARSGPAFHAARSLVAERLQPLMLG